MFYVSKSFNLQILSIPIVSYLFEEEFYDASFP